MYKFFTAITYRRHARIPSKLFLIMKLAFFLTMAVCLQVTAASYAQKISINRNDASLSEVLNDIRRQSGFNVLYDVNMLRSARPVTLHLEGASLEETLKDCFSGQQFSYVINQNTIVVTPKPASNKTVNVQPINIMGRIINNKNEPLAGVNITIKGTKDVVVTNEDGRYVVTVPNSRSVLIFSYIGFASQSIVVGDQKQIDVELVEQYSALNEVIVEGYGSVRKGDLTGSVSSVKMADMQKAPVISFEDALAGRMAGVQVTSPEGQPGEPSTIVIRGNNSVTQDNSPLYVIDGFPIEDPDNNAINPADIESINVLKDASATAIYGARAANGVIVITTKRGNVGAPVITYDGYYGIQRNIKQMQMMDAYNFVEYQIERSGSSAQLAYTPGDPSLAGQVGYVPGGRTLAYYKTAPSTNWQDLLYQTAPMENHNLSVRGGNAQTQYSVSGSYVKQDGIILNSGFGRYQGRITLDQKIGNKLKLSLNTNYSSSNTFGISPSQNEGSSTANLLFAAMGYRPVVDANNDVDLIDVGEDPATGSGDDRYNPIMEAENAVVQNRVNTLIANGALSYDISKSLTLRISGGINQQQNKNIRFYNSHTKEGDITNQIGVTDGPNGTILNGSVNNYLNENTLTWNKVFNKDNTLNIVGGYTMQSYTTSSYGYTATHLPNESLGIDGLDQGTPTTTVATSSNNFLESYLTRVNYSYKDKYLLTASYRADGSSKFAPSNRWGYFPSGAVAWRISSEPFAQKLTFLSDAKFRGSYGVTGNNRVTDFAYLSQVNFPIGNNYTFDNVYNIGSIPTLGNQNLKWETTAQSDVGLDVSFLKGRIALTADYYDKVTSNLLLNAELPPSSGYPTGYENIGKVSNHGWEFELNTVNVKSKNFSWNSSFNISFNRNKVLELTRNQESQQTAVKWDTGFSDSFPYIAMIGQPIALFYGYKWEGNYQYSDFNKMPNGTYVLKSTVPDNGSGRTAVQPGDIKYADLNGDGTVNALDRTVIGNPNPKSTGGFSNNFTYKGFSLNVFLQWSYGNDILNANRLVFEGSDRVALNQFADYEDRWTPENQNNTYYRVGGYGPSGDYSSRVIEDGSFLRLKTVSLGYNLPSQWLKSIGFKSFKVYVSGQNLATVTGYSGSDPEVSTKSSALTPGFDYSAYPRPRTMVVGVDCSL
jgi:TonB-linked SusC/RagA family outer membrane protein